MISSLGYLILQAGLGRRLKWLLIVVRWNGLVAQELIQCLTFAWGGLSTLQLFPSSWWSFMVAIDGLILGPLVLQLVDGVWVIDFLIATHQVCQVWWHVWQADRGLNRVLRQMTWALYMNGLFGSEELAEIYFPTALGHLQLGHVSLLSHFLFLPISSCSPARSHQGWLYRGDTNFACLLELWLPCKGGSSAIRHRPYQPWWTWLLAEPLSLHVALHRFRILVVA